MVDTHSLAGASMLTANKFPAQLGPSRGPMVEPAIISNNKGTYQVDLSSPTTWRWIWFIAALVFAAGELISAASFFFLPFSVGALCAALLSLFGVNVVVGWVVFTIVSIVAFAGFWPLARRLEAADTDQEGVGATRWIGQMALVVEDIKPNKLGAVRLEREQWRAESLTGQPIAKGENVVITSVAGTRLVVALVDENSEVSQQSSLTPGGPTPNPSEGE